jgi:hypothetical protein
LFHPHDTVTAAQVIVLDVLSPASLQVIATAAACAIQQHHSTNHYL